MPGRLFPLPRRGWLPGLVGLVVILGVVAMHGASAAPPLTSSAGAVVQASQSLAPVHHSAVLPMTSVLPAAAAPASVPPPDAPQPGHDAHRIAPCLAAMGGSVATHLTLGASLSDARPGSPARHSAAPGIRPARQARDVDLLTLCISRT